MLLPIGQDDAEVVGFTTNGLHLPVHGAEIEYCDTCHVTFERQGHTHIVTEDNVHRNGRPATRPEQEQAEWEHEISLSLDSTESVHLLSSEAS